MIPQRTIEQRRLAGQQAAENRRQRSQLRHLLNRGSMSLEQWFDLCDQDRSGVAARTRVVDVVRAHPGHRRKERALVVLETVGISPTRRVRGLGRHQRAQLVSEMFQRVELPARECA